MAASARILSRDQFSREAAPALRSRSRRRAIATLRDLDPANIAEECGKGSRKETIRYFQIALGSATETENHLIIAADFGYVSPDVRDALLADIKVIQRMLAKLAMNLP